MGLWRHALFGGFQTGAEGGSGAPEWVPDGAKIHIDFLGGTPQGRAWVDGTGEVAIGTLLGSDPNSGAVWADTVYDSSKIGPNGYKPVESTAFIGAARTKILAGVTMRYQTKNQVAVGSTDALVIISGDGNDATEITLTTSVSISSYNGPTTGGTTAVLSVASGATNGIAFTLTPARFEAAGNGDSTVADLDLVAGDYPTAPTPLVVLFEFVDANDPTVQSITIYDPLPDTSGLPGLSEPDGASMTFESSSVSSRSISGGAI